MTEITLSVEAIQQIQDIFDPLYQAVCILIMLGIAVLGVKIWKR